MESSIEKNTSFQIHCCTIFPTFGSVSGKQIIQSFVYLIIMWVVNTMDYFVSYVGAEVMFQEIIDLSMLIFASVIVSQHLHIHSIEPVYWQEGVLFYIIIHKTCHQQIDAEGMHLLLSWIYQNNFLFFAYDTTSSISWYRGHHTCENLSNYHSWSSLQGDFFLFNVLLHYVESAINYGSVMFKSILPTPFSLIPLTLGRTKLVLFPSVQCRISVA